MLELEISSEAENDLLETWLYIAEDQPINIYQSACLFWVAGILHLRSFCHQWHYFLFSTQHALSLSVPDPLVSTNRPSGMCALVRKHIQSGIPLAQCLIDNRSNLANRMPRKNT